MVVCVFVLYQKYIEPIFKVLFLVVLFQLQTTVFWVNQYRNSDRVIIELLFMVVILWFKDFCLFETLLLGMYVFEIEDVIHENQKVMLICYSFYFFTIAC